MKNSSNGVDRYIYLHSNGPTKSGDFFLKQADKKTRKNTDYDCYESWSCLWPSPIAPQERETKIARNAQKKFEQIFYEIYFIKIQSSHFTAKKG